MPGPGESIRKEVAVDGRLITSRKPDDLPAFMNAVVAALVAKHGIAAGRLKGLGVGPVAPVASNRTEEGRAKNRRVELVER